jgi:sensor histidine kinase YesM
MKLRYTDKVTINMELPDNCPDDIVLVPLVFMPFVENAFKHGVSYTAPSIIDIDIKREGERLLFHCRNTKNDTVYEHGGVGLTNVSKRLELIYGTDYTIDIQDGKDTYDVLLNLPERHPADFDKSHDKS